MRLAINGFGRIGRNVFKVAFESKDIEVVAVNDLTGAHCLSHLLKYDSSYGVYGRQVACSTSSSSPGKQDLLVDDKIIKVFSEKDPKNLPWKDLKVDVVIESTGIFRVASSPKGGYDDHILAGAKKVILTVPAADEIKTIVLGVNDQKIDKDTLAYSNASCTTNCLAPLVKVLNDSFGVVNGLMTTVHAYTNDQVILDGPHLDLRRARNAANNIIPTATGAAKAIGLVLPKLDGKLHGGAIRVPVAIGSLVDLTVNLREPVTKEEVNRAFTVAGEGPMRGILRYTEDPIVSRDIIGDPHSSIIDGLSTTVLDGTLLKVLSWYDNEWGYSNRVVELAQKIVG